jgi:ATP-binding cassette, subfamily B, bacterial
MDGPNAGEELQATVPAHIRELAVTHLAGEEVVGFSEYDIDDDLRYTHCTALLSDTRLVLLTARPPQVFAISDIEEAGIDEGLGLDRLRIVLKGKLEGTARYSRKHRVTMQRLNRKLQRRLPKRAEAAPTDGKPAKPDEPPPPWLETIERRAEAQDLCRKCGRMIPSYADGVCPTCLQKRTILLRLLDVAKPYRKPINVALGLTLVHALIQPLQLVAQAGIIDKALVATTLPQSERLYNLGLFTLAFVGIIVVSEVIGGLRMGILSTVGTSVTRDLRHGVYAHLHALSLRFFNKRRTGSLITRVTNDTDRLWDFIVFGSVNFVRDILMIFAYAVVMFAMNWKLAILALAPVPVVAILTYIRGRKMHAAWSRVWTYWSRITAVVGDALPGVRVIKAFGNEEREIARFNKRSDEYTVKEQETNKLWWSMQPITSGIMRFGGLSVLAVGGLLMILDTTGKTTIGQLLAFSGAVWQFYGPVMELVNANRMVTRSATSAARVFEVLDTPPDIFDRRGAHNPATVRGEIEFRNVFFSYEGAQPALRDVSLLLHPGEMVGLCGPSGAGKSTFVNLIPRFYDVTDGQILLDGVDIRDWDVHALRRSIGMVLQEPHLFHGTIADNIRYGNPAADIEQVIEAAKAANAHDFVVGFPDGYDTMVGERGQSLSGGERQRVSIARAILHNPRILILDEATSSVDTETEKQIQQALDRLVTGRTTIAIAHRLSTLSAAKRLIVLERGKIVETGSHDELSGKEDGVYAKLVRTQKELGSLVAVAG